MENKNTGKQCAVKFTWNRSLYNEFLMMNLVQDIVSLLKIIYNLNINYINLLFFLF